MVKLQHRWVYLKENIQYFVKVRVLTKSLYIFIFNSLKRRKLYVIVGRYVIYDKKALRF